MKSRFFHKRITAIWEHVGNFGLQSPSIQLNYSNFWLSHITDHNFKMFSWLSIAFFWFAPTSGLALKKISKSIMLQIGVSMRVFLPFYKETNTIYSTFFLHLNIFFCISSCNTHNSCTKSWCFSSFIRAPNRVCCLPFFVHHIMLFSVFFMHHIVLFVIFFVHHIAFCCNSSSTKSCLKSSYCNSAW